MIVSTTYQPRQVLSMIRRVDRHAGRQEINAA
jgi:hypothetical protein